ncbi:hypothetical protein LMG9446_2173 [Lactococcus lactis subsp. lactis]|nr:hypothetical protein LMG9446_2173 [Lactococcus lactis subsp. lactis]
MNLPLSFFSSLFTDRKFSKLIFLLFADKMLLIQSLFTDGFIFW